MVKLDRNPRSVICIVSALGIFIIGVVLTLAFFDNTTLLGVGVTMAVLGGAGAILGCIHLIARNNTRTGGGNGGLGDEIDEAEEAARRANMGAAPSRIPPTSEFGGEAGAMGYGDQELYYEPCTASPPRSRNPAAASDPSALRQRRPLGPIDVNNETGEYDAREFYNPTASKRPGDEVIYRSPKKVLETGTSPRRGGGGGVPQSGLSTPGVPRVVPPPVVGNAAVDHNTIMLSPYEQRRYPVPSSSMALPAPPLTPPPQTGGVYQNHTTPQRGPSEAFAPFDTSAERRPVPDFYAQPPPLQQQQQQHVPSAYDRPFRSHSSGGDVSQLQNNNNNNNNSSAIGGVGPSVWRSSSNNNNNNYNYPRAAVPSLSYGGGGGPSSRTGSTGHYSSSAAPQQYWSPAR